MVPHYTANKYVNCGIVTMIRYIDDALLLIEIRSVLKTIGDETNE